MNTRIFRQVALARLSSPEELDLILRVSSPKDWIGLLAIGVLLAIAMAWALLGSISMAVNGQGVIVRSGGVMNVVSRGSGLMVRLSVDVGSRVEANQVVATVAQPVLAERLKTVREQLAWAIEQRRRSLEIRGNLARLAAQAIQRQRATNESRIAALAEQVKLAGEQIAVSEQLLAKGLVTRQQVLNNRERRASLENEIDNLRAQNKQLDSQEFGTHSQAVQEDAELRSRVALLDREVAGLETEFNLAEKVVSPYSGRVLEVKTDAGGTVAAGDPIISVQADEQELEMIAYLPSPQAKDAAPGMDVQVSPGIVKREEYGFLLGKVTYVHEYPATAAAMMRHFENDQLVRALSTAGPVTELRVRLIRDASTSSGFRWSTPRGAPITLSSGTICDVRIVTRKQAPITLLLPFLRNRLGVR